MNIAAYLDRMSRTARITGVPMAVVAGTLLLGVGCAAGQGTDTSAAALVAQWTIDQPIVGHVLPCQAGQVLAFPCKEVDLLSFLPISAISGVVGAKEEEGGRLKEVWGWTDAASRREFALIAQSGGTAFVEVTDPVRPRYLGTLSRTSGTEPSPARELKVYRHYVFVVADQVGDHGIQIFDLNQLLTVSGAPVVFQETAHYDQGDSTSNLVDRIGSTHNIVIDTATGFAYTVGGHLCGGGLNMIDIHTPTAPTAAGCYSDLLGGAEANRYVHDAQCVVYHGPDRRYRGRELCLNAASTAGLAIVDVTDKRQPKTIGVSSYPSLIAAHQGWLTDDQRYLLLGDELDETNRGGNAKIGSKGPLTAEDSVYPTRTLIFDLTDLEDPVLTKEFLGTTRATDHNQYIRGQYTYQANYTAGLRILDIADPRQPREVAYFDTYPGPDPATATTAGTRFMAAVRGAWGNYPFFKSGAIAISSQDEGLFLVRFRGAGAKR